MAAKSVVCACWSELVVTFKIEGQATMLQAPAIRQTAERALAEGATAMFVDLRGCCYMDSTFIGTLLYLKRAVAAAAGEFALVCLSAECRQLLKQMRLDGVFPTLPVDESAEREWTELQGETPDLNIFKRNIVEAHQELAGLSGPAGDPFRSLAARMSGELQTEAKR